MNKTQDRKGETPCCAVFACVEFSFWNIKKIDLKWFTVHLLVRYTTATSEIHPLICNLCIFRHYPLALPSSCGLTCTDVCLFFRSFDLSPCCILPWILPDVISLLLLFLRGTALLLDMDGCYSQCRYWSGWSHSVPRARWKSGRHLKIYKKKPDKRPVTSAEYGISIISITASLIKT